MGRDDRFMTSDVLIRCGYYESKTKSSFEREVRDTVASYIAQASSGDRGTAGEMQEHRSSQPIAAAHFLPLCTYIAKLKHAGFSDESEWRLGFYLQPNSIPADLCLRAGSSMLVPYLEIPLGVTGKFSVVGLNEIVVGPCPHPEESRKSVEMLLHQAGFKGVQVKSSQNPLPQLVNPFRATLRSGRRTGRSLPEVLAQAGVPGRGKSELRRAVCRITSGTRASNPVDG